MKNICYKWLDRRVRARGLQAIAVLCRLSALLFMSIPIAVGQEARPVLPPSAEPDAVSDKTLRFSPIRRFQQEESMPRATRRIVEHAEAAFEDDCEKLLVREIDKAEKEILVAIYSLTRKDITSALVRASERGVNVSVKYDAGSHEWQGMKIAIGYLKKRGIQCAPIEMTDEYAKMHHKFTVVDGKRVLTGSFNYTTSGATSNYEDLILLESERVAAEYTRQFHAIKNR